MTASSPEPETPPRFRASRLTSSHRSLFSSGKSSSSPPPASEGRSSAFRLAVTALLLAACAILAQPAAAQNDLHTTRHLPDGVEAQIERSLAGPDFDGKDGPMAKVGRSLTTMYHEYQWHKRAKSGTPYEAPIEGAFVEDGMVVIDAKAAGDGRVLLDQLRSVGLQDGTRAGNVVSGRVPIERLDEVAALSALRRAMPSLAATPRPLPPSALRSALRGQTGGGETGGAVGNGRAAAKVGRVTSEGDAAMQTDSARVRYNVDGSGVTIGVISDSYNTATGEETTAQEDIRSGDLPGRNNPNGYTQSTVVLDDNATSNSDEGRAMMQLIHDVAPGAKMVFHTGIGVGIAGFADAIRELRREGADVIVDDIGLFLEPMFQDGVVADAIRDVTEDGAVYLSSAGNSGSAGYGDAFRPLTGTPGRLETTNVPHDFQSGDQLQEVFIAEGATGIFVLQWDDPFTRAGGGGADTDLDIYLTDKQGNQILAVSDADNNGSATSSAGDPIESFSFENDGSIDADGDGEADQRFQVGIERVDGPEPDFLRYVMVRGGSPTEFLEDDPNDPADGPATLYGHAAAPNCIAVGASAYFYSPAFFPDELDGRAVNSFSSRSGMPTLFDRQGNRLAEPVFRAKPEITGPDGASNTFFGDSDPEEDGFPNFFGTSAAAPHVAGLVALIRNADPNAPFDRVTQELRTTAEDIQYITPFRIPPRQFSIPTVATIDGMNGVGPDRYTGTGFVNAQEALLAFAEVSGFTADLASNGGQGVTVTWQELESADIQGYTLRRTYVDDISRSPVTSDTSIAVTASGSYDVAFDQLPPGRHEFRLTYTKADGTTLQTSIATATVPVQAEAEVIGPYPNPVTAGQTFVRVAVDQTQEVRFNLYDALGRRVGTTERRIEANRPTNVRLGAENFRISELASGVYFIRLDGRLFSDTVQMVIAR